ncbi:serine/threonine-protein kinase PknK [Haliangium sp.]|uniref:serine/threonine-protein kinase n=1 Tax=Haliangium sp. TaxID=2663208 RepID=UPI003D15000C
MSVPIMVEPELSQEFTGTFRFEVVRRLGAGAIGRVYEAIDRAYDTPVAIKTLHKLSAAELLRFKNEFRLLQGIHHHNLVQLGELFEEGGLWFYSMELVDGVDFLSYVRTGAGPARAATATKPNLSRQITHARPTRTTKPLSAGGGGFHEPRLREALRQLADGLHAVHRAGRIHCDIKPQNVMVSDDRVVLLDFGLVSEAQPWHQHDLDDGYIMGTPAYMAPEQARGESATAAADWYAVGAMMYQALTGSLPFPGNGLQVLRAKLSQCPPSPSQLMGADASLVPADLEELCMQLLARDPAARPPGARVLARLAGGTTAMIDLAALALPSAELASDLVGRESELGELRAALQRSQRGQPAVALVHGRSGMGKSEVIDHFAHELRDHTDALVLRSRCYERETVPYKAFDGVIDALTGFLEELCAPPQPTAGRGSGPIPHPHRPLDHDDSVVARDLRSLLAQEVEVLARLFPMLGLVLSRAPSPAARRSGAGQVHAEALRRRAFAALKRLLAYLAERWPLVIIVDDLHWGDMDSAALLAELIAPPRAPGLLLVASYSDDDAHGDSLQWLHQSVARSLPATAVSEVEIGPLSERDSYRLAMSIWERLGDYGGQADDRAERGRQLARAATREAGGTPLFVVEIMRHLATSTAARTDAIPGAISLEHVISERRRRLEPAARTLVEVIAVAGRPVPQGVALRAAGISGTEVGAVAALRAAHLIRTRGPGLDDNVEIYHERVRAAVAAHIDDDALRGHHGWLAEALEDWGCQDGELLAIHYRGAGRLERAAEFARQAAAQAEAALAFDRAARMYRLVLDILPDDAATGSVYAQLGDALARAERGGEAAEAYLSAAERAAAAGAEREVWLDHRRQAAEQLLRSGDIDRGVELLGHTLHASGLRMPRTAPGTFTSLFVRRLMLRGRGLGYRPRTDVAADAGQRLRADVCWTAASGLAAVDHVRAADFATRGLLMALRQGDEARIATHLAFEACYLVTKGGSAFSRAVKLAREAVAIANGTDDPLAHAFATFAPGAIALFAGRWRFAQQTIERADAILRTRCTGVSWESSTACIYQFTALYFLGEWRLLHERTAALILAAQERGDRYTVAGLAPFAVYGHLSIDDVAGAHEALRQGAIQWTTSGYHLQHYLQLAAEVRLGLYSGQPAAVWARLEQDRCRLRHAVPLRMTLLAADLAFLRGRCALAYAAADSTRAPTLIRTASRAARRLEGYGLAWCDAVAALVRAGMAACRGDAELAAAGLARAAQDLDRGDMPLLAAAARRRRGQLVGGADGQRLIDDADAAMNLRGIARPAALTRMLVPGFSEPPVSDATPAR